MATIFLTNPRGGRFLINWDNVAWSAYREGNTAVYLINESDKQPIEVVELLEEIEEKLKEANKQCTYSCNKG